MQISTNIDWRFDFCFFLLWNDLCELCVMLYCSWHAVVVLFYIVILLVQFNLLFISEWDFYRFYRMHDMCDQKFLNLLASNTICHVFFLRFQFRNGKIKLVNRIKINCQEIWWNVFENEDLLDVEEWTIDVEIWRCWTGRISHLLTNFLYRLQ